MTPHSINRTAVSLLLAILGPLAVLWYLQFYFETPPIGEQPFSLQRYRLMARTFSPESAAPYVFAAMWATGGLAVLVGSLCGRGCRDAIADVGAANVFTAGLVAHLLGSYYVASKGPGFLEVWAMLSPAFLCLTVAGWLTCHWQAAFSNVRGWAWAWTGLTLAAALYAAVFSTMAIGQYQALNVPHGDTAMYEEHLWNLKEGKGFRSQLDDGRSFLGEHFQVVHALLLPVYALWPTLPTLYICKSLALALGAFAVAWTAKSRQLPAAAGFALGTAYLLYFPMQYLDAELQWKNFRPEPFGVPLMLFALAALEAGRRRMFVVFCVLTLLVKEEWAIAWVGLGAYLFVQSPRGEEGKSQRRSGIGLAVAGVVALSALLWLVIPYFRGGEPHYAPYFARLRENPRVAWELLFSPQNARFLLLMLAPLAFVPLASPLRFAVSLPFWGYLMLGDPDRNLNEPFFHFHAPLVPLLIWATVGGVARLGRRWEPVVLARLIACAALATGFWFGKSPLAWKFYDPLDGKPRRQEGIFTVWEPLGIYWRDLYVPHARAEAFENVLDVVSPEDRVAATDYVRARFTRFAAAHDYPSFRGHVTIEDIDVVVLDLTEGWWGRGLSNPDRELLACVNDPQCGAGARLTIRGAPFEIVYRDAFFLVARKQPD